ncbi:MAG TPA: hypothetical protein PKI03_00690 [Pseudomonadota bacterium]|nr:hypothetical protein [Pseudomonadota bacterium]
MIVAHPPPSPSRELAPGATPRCALRGRIEAVALLAFSLSLSGWLGSGAAQTPAPPAAPAATPVPPATGPRPRTGIPPLRGGDVGGGAANAAGILRVVSQRGDVVYNHGGEPPELSVSPTTALAARDEVLTRRGGIELVSAAGTSLALGSNSLAALLARDAVYLARGEVTISTRGGQPPAMFYVATPCGRSWIRAKEARLRVEGNVTTTEVIDGYVRLGGNNPGAVDVRSGQASRCSKGEPASQPHTLLPAPQWLSVPDLFLTGEATREVGLRFSPVMGAARYRADLLRFESGPDPVLVSSQELAGDQPQLELPGVEVGSYHVRVFAIDDIGARGMEGPPIRFLIARVSGLSPTGMVHTQVGQLPIVSGPPSLPVSVLLDGDVPPAGAPSRGMHRLRVMVAGLMAEVPLSTTVPTDDTPPPAIDPMVSPPPVAVVTPAPPVAPPAEPGSGGSPSPTDGPAHGAVAGLATDPHAVPPLSPASVNAEDVLLGGFGEAPLEGVRSPWARSHIGARLEFSTHGAMRFAAGGRLLMRGGFGADLWVSALRASFSTPTGETAAGFGNINAAVRTPALRRSRFALQGMASVVGATSTSYLDRSIAVDPVYSSDGFPLRRDVLPGGGGWRAEGTALVGVAFGNFVLFTNHGASLRVAPNFAASYVGGVALQADVLSLVRFVSFASWEVGYIGFKVTPESAQPDAGGAVGGGFEVPLKLGGRGVLRLSLLGRAGLGQGGIAIYGRGTVGLQAGYVFK